MLRSVAADWPASADRSTSPRSWTVRLRHQLLCTSGRTASRSVSRARAVDPPALVAVGSDAWAAKAPPIRASIISSSARSPSSAPIAAKPPAPAAAAPTGGRTCAPPSTTCRAAPPTAPSSISFGPPPWP